MVASVRVLALDPGVATGLALYDDSFPSSDPLRLVTAEMDQMTTCDRAKVIVQSSTYPVAAVVCESYRITAETIRKTRQTASLEIIGCICWLCHESGVPFLLQSPDDAKRFMPDAKLKALD